MGELLEQTMHVNFQEFTPKQRNKIKSILKKRYKEGEKEKIVSDVKEFLRSQNKDPQTIYLTDYGSDRVFVCLYIELIDTQYWIKLTQTDLKNTEL